VGIIAAISAENPAANVYVADLLDRYHGSSSPGTSKTFEVELVRKGVGVTFLASSLEGDFGRENLHPH